MARFFGTQIILPLDPTLLFHAATMGWVQANRTILPVTTISWASTITPNASSGASYHRCTLGGATTVAAPTGGVDTQEVWLELTGQATLSTVVTFAASWELGTNVTTRTGTILAGVVAYLRAINRGGTWRLLAADGITFS